MELGKDGLGVPQILADAVEVQGVGEPAVVAGGGDIFALSQDVDHVSVNRDLLAKVDDLEVGADRLREDPDPGGLVVGCRRKVLGAGGECGTLGPPPEVHLVGEVSAQGVGRDSQAFGQGESGGELFQAEFLNLGAKARVGGVRQIVNPGARLNDRQDRSPGDPGPLPRQLNASDRGGHVQVGRQHGVDDPVESGVGKRLPPLERLVSSGGWTLLEVRRHLRCRVG